MAPYRIPVAEELKDAVIRMRETWLKHHRLQFRDTGK